MQFLRSVLGGGGGFNLPYVIGEPFAHAWGSWTHYRGTSKEDNSPVSIFAITGANAQDNRLAAARNGVKRLKMLRHPNVLSFLYSAETETVENGVAKPTIYMVTEPVLPLAEKLKELNLEGTQRDEYYAWGLQAISKAISFLNNDCKLVHGNVCVASVVVTTTLDWKLHAFDVLSEFDGGNPAAEGPMLVNEWMVGTQYKPMEVSKSDWATVRRSPPWGIDSWGLGCLIYELFSGSMLSRTEDLRNTSPIPKMLLPDYQKLLHSVAARRMNPSKLVDNAEFFQNKLVETIHFMEVLNLKDSMEKDNFFRKMPVLIDQLPRQIVILKLLPLLASALEFGSAAATGLIPLLKIGTWIPQDDFTVKILPTITKLFASSDRAIRIGLLQNIDSYGASLSPTIVDEQVFPHVATGFSDTSAFLRELTLKSMLTLASKLSQRTLGGSLLKHLSKLQVDEEPAIRTNTTILLGNIARHLNDSTRKRVLVNAFTVRALRDGFPPARGAGIMALMATAEYYDAMEIATRILPHLVVLTVDPDPDVRGKAFQGSDVFLQAVKDHYNKLEGEDGESLQPKSPATSAGASSLIGWAVSSLSLKGAKAGEDKAASPIVAPPQPTAAGAASTAKAAPRASPVEMPVVEPATNVSRASSDGWADVGEMDSSTNDEADGWDDLEAIEEPVNASLARIQAAQQKSIPSNNRPRPLSGAAAPQPPPRVNSAGSNLSTFGADSSEKGASDGWDNDDDPWASLAAPPPKMTVKPLNATSASSGPGTRPRPGAQAQHVSLDSILGSSKMGEGGSGRGRGRAKAAPKLGAQRLSK